METKRSQKVAIKEALEAQGYEILTAQGGFFIRGIGYVTQTAARKMTGIAVPENLKRQPATEISAYGEWAIVAKINGIR